MPSLALLSLTERLIGKRRTPAYEGTLSDVYGGFSDTVINSINISEEETGCTACLVALGCGMVSGRKLAEWLWLIPAKVRLIPLAGFLRIHGDRIAGMAGYGFVWRLSLRLYPSLRSDSSGGGQWMHTKRIFYKVGRVVSFPVSIRR